MREINIDELKNLPVGTTVKCEWYNKDDNYLRKTEYITILDTTTYKDNHVILWDGSNRHHLNTFIDVTTRTAEQLDTVGYKLSVIETPYEKIWNDLKEEINSNIHYLKDKDKYWPKEDKERFICTYKNTLEIIRRLEKENRINVDFFVKK